DVPGSVALEHTGIDQLVLGVGARATRVLRDQLVVREGRPWVGVPPAHPRMRRRGIQVPPILLRVLAVVALGIAEPEDALLEDRIAAVPEREAEAEPLSDVADRAETVLAPPVRAGAGVVVREIRPG